MNSQDLSVFFFRIALLQTDIVRASMPAQVIKKAKVVYVLRYFQMNFFYKMKNFKSVFYCYVYKLTYRKHNIYALFGRLKQIFSCLYNSIFDAPILLS